MITLKAPFPYFGGKSGAASLVWERFGNTPNYVEPFAGSLAVLLGRPEIGKIETVNDLDGLLSNVWRAIRHNPKAVAMYADQPVLEVDLTARHLALVNAREDITSRLMADPEFFDAKLAGWWIWGMSNWIGGGWCSGEGPWTAENGVLVKKDVGDSGKGVQKVGVSRQIPYLGSAGTGVASSSGIRRKLPSLSTHGSGINSERASSGVLAWMQALSERLARVRMTCGDWSRVTGESVTVKNGLTAVFLDPPYADTAKRQADLYAKDCLQVAHDVRAWAIANGDNPNLRIALCGYEGEYQMPSDWVAEPWKARKGYQKAKEGTHSGQREVIWFSPHCLKPVIQKRRYEQRQARQESLWVTP